MRPTRFSPTPNAAPVRHLLLLAIVAGLSRPLPHFAQPAPASSSPALSQLTYSGSQDAIAAIDRAIAAAGTDAGKLAAVEQRLLQLLRRAESTFAARQAAAQRLGHVLAVGPARTKPDDFKPLDTLLTDERDSDLARLALEPVAGETVDQLFVAALEKTSGRVRLGVIDSIARRRAAPGVPALTKLLKDEDAATTAAAARALGEIANPAAVAALHATAEPSPAPVAAAKLAAAARSPAAASLGMLNELQRKARDPVHRAAAFRQALDIERGTAAARIAEVLGGGDWTMKQVALEAIFGSRAPNLVTTLAGKLASWDAPTQRAVIAALGRRGDSAATAAVTAAVKHADADVRDAAITALGQLPGTRDTAMLLAKLSAGDDSDDAKTARLALARLNGPDVSATILSGAERGDPATRVAFLEQLALRNMTEGLDLLLKTRADPDVAVRTAGVAALGEIAPAADQQALLDWTIEATDETEQSRALRSFVNVTLRQREEEQRGAPLFALIQNAPPELTLRLLPALGRIGGRSSAETAAKLALRDDPKIAEAATNALTRWSDATALGSLATVAEKAAIADSRTAALNGALRYLERNRGDWTAESTSLVSRLLGAATEPEPRRKLLLLLHRADDNAALDLANSLKSDATIGTEAATAADVVRANLAGKPKARASATSSVGNLTDGKTSTRWSAPALGEEWIELDFHLSRPVQRLTLDQTGRAAEFPASYEVYVTDDPKQPGTAAATGKGQRGSRTVVELPAGTRGRYLIVKNVAERKDAPWAVCEVYVD